MSCHSNAQRWVDVTFISAALSTCSCCCSMDLAVGLCVHHRDQSAVPAGCCTGAHPQSVLLQVPAHLPCGAGSGHTEWWCPPPSAASRKTKWTFCLKRLSDVCLMTTDCMCTALLGFAIELVNCLFCHGALSSCIFPYSVLSSSLKEAMITVTMSTVMELMRTQICSRSLMVCGRVWQHWQESTFSSSSSTASGWSNITKTMGYEAASDRTGTVVSVWTSASYSNPLPSGQNNLGCEGWDRTTKKWLNKCRW